MKNNLQKRSKRNYANTISILGKITQYFDTQVLSKCKKDLGQLTMIKVFFKN